MKSSLDLSELIKIGVAASILHFVFYEMFGTSQWFATMICGCMGLFWKQPTEKFGKTDS